MKLPLVSVIVPVHNAEKFLRLCVASILSQTMTDFELLLIDDGSQDKGGAICDAYAQKDNRIHVFHQPNAGVSHARNTGLDYACGQYVVFVDSDDYVLPDYLRSLYEDVCGHQGVGLIIQGAHGVNSQGEPLRDFLFPDICLPYQRFDEAFAEYELWFWGFSWGKIYQKAVLDAHHIRFDEGISCREDLLFMLRYLFFCDYLQFRPAMNYIYIYYTHSLSHGKLHSFDTEYHTFIAFRGIAPQIVQTWHFSGGKAMTVTLADIFQRALKTDYQLYHKVCRKERIKHVIMLTDAAGNFLQTGCRHFAFKIDWLGGLLLEWRLFTCYDLFISLMFSFPIRRFAYDPLRASNRGI